MLQERLEKSGSRVVGSRASCVKKACVGALQRLRQDVTQPLCRGSSTTQGDEGKNRRKTCNDTTQAFEDKNGRKAMWVPPLACPDHYSGVWHICAEDRQDKRLSLIA